jgi:hypothetical protein
MRLLRISLLAGEPDAYRQRFRSLYRAMREAPEFRKTSRSEWP